jgi:hypothetical protein
MMLMVRRAITSTASRRRARVASKPGASWAMSFTFDAIKKAIEGA